MYECALCGGSGETDQEIPEACLACKNFIVEEDNDPTPIDEIAECENWN